MKKLTREQEAAKKKQIRTESRIRFREFIKVILDFQLQEHQKFLRKFNIVFKRIDTECSGILNELQFRNLIAKMHESCDGGIYTFD